MYVVVIGIDRYRAWNPLSNAAHDARGAQHAFEQLGFLAARPPLLDEAATGAALQSLVTDELRALGTDDSLVVFFAGHGHTVTTTYPDGVLAKIGYLIPVDGAPPGGGTGSWVTLHSWLSELARLLPRHILVILDACHSGIALDPVIRWRGEDLRLTEPLETLRARRSRRIITSALDQQLAMDSGPVAGHSLFTGCLIEALTGGLRAKTGQPMATGSEIALHVQHRVATFPRSSQTPDFGALELDNRGELIIAWSPQAPAPPLPPHRPRTQGPGDILARTHGTGEPPGKPLRPVGAESILSRRAATAPPAPIAAAPAPEPAAPNPPPAEPATPPNRNVAPAAPSADPVTAARSAVPAAADRSPRPSGSALDAAFVAALNRHDVVRQRGDFLTLVAADPMTALTGWATWAASRGHLTLVTKETSLDAAIADLLSQMPWLRSVPAARQRLAAATRLEVAAVDDALDRRSGPEREAWIDEVSGHDRPARVSGWLLSVLREPWARIADLAAPVQGGDLLAILCELAVPITVLLHHPEPTATWLERALHTAGELVGFLPRRAIAIAGPGELISDVLRDHPESAALSAARQEVVPLAARPPRAADPARPRPAQLLHAALDRDPRTAGLFALDAQVPTHDHERPVDVDLVARGALLAVEIDGWYQFRDPHGYRRDRIKDAWLSRAGFFVMRFLAEDVECRLERVIDEIAIGLAGRRASGSFLENPQ